MGQDGERTAPGIQPSALLHCPSRSSSQGTGPLVSDNGSGMEEALGAWTRPLHSSSPLSHLARSIRWDRDPVTSQCLTSLEMQERLPPHQARRHLLPPSSVLKPQMQDSDHIRGVTPTLPLRNPTGSHGIAEPHGCLKVAPTHLAVQSQELGKGNVAERILVFIFRSKERKQGAPQTITGANVQHTLPFIPLEPSLGVLVSWV